MERMGSDDVRVWDDYADAFDDDPDHGLRDPAVRTAWVETLLPLLPASGARIADLGCGTGSLSVLLAEHGFDVTGLDVSERMLARASAKAGAAGVSVDFRLGDASAPDLAKGVFDVVLSRHVLWIFDDTDAVLERWLELLHPDGRLLLIEGRWSSGAGLTAGDCSALVLRHRTSADVIDLTGDIALWGGPVDDERYALLSRA